MHLRLSEFGDMFRNLDIAGSLPLFSHTLSLSSHSVTLSHTLPLFLALYHSPSHSITLSHTLSLSLRSATLSHTLPCTLPDAHSVTLLVLRNVRLLLQATLWLYAWL